MTKRQILIAAMLTFLSISSQAVAIDIASSATPADQISLLPGFKAELLYSVPTAEQGSWVSLTTDNKGRLIASDQNGALYRITVPPVGAKDKQSQVEKLKVDMGMAHGLCYAFDSLYTVVNGGKQYKSGIYRLRDTTGDDQFDEVKLLREIAGRGEHGPHGIVMGPDGKSLYLAAGNHTDLPTMEKSVVPRNWQEDQLLPRMVDARGHAASRRAPGGWICRLDPDGNVFELVSIGYRNEYDIAFNADGELFTYDSDMEWDVGTPWYRPTRVAHVTSGSEFGWRTGTGKWPTYYPDSLPAVVDIGPGSPTGVVFGTGAKFPAKYRRALFICDWSYGTLYAVHLKPNGSSYTGEAERFASAAPLPLTDIVVHPTDGAMYFTIGGRGTQSGLYRITYAGDAVTEPAKPAADAAGAKLRAERRQLESLHHVGAKGAVEKAWPYLSHADRHIRYAARIALEHQPVAKWQDRALAETDPRALIAAVVALARNADAALKPKMLAALARIDIEKLERPDQLDLLRAYGLTFARMGKPAEAARRSIAASLDRLYPARGPRLNRELCSLLVYLEAEGVVAKSLKLLAGAPTQEEQIHYALALRSLEKGWTLPQRREYFTWFNNAAEHRGGASFGGFLRNIRNEAIERLSDNDMKALAKVLTATPKPVDPTVQVKARPFVKKWTVDDLLAAVESDEGPRDLARGRKLFATGACFKCHRFAGEGGLVGPDLTGVGRRFNTRNLIETIVEPSKVISDQYQSHNFILASGKTVTGRVVNLSGDSLRVMTDMLDPGSLTAVKRSEIEEMIPSPTSMMPTGMLDTFSKDEILDMLAFLRSGGAADFQAARE